MEISLRTILVSFFVYFVLTAEAMACVGCGQTRVFSPKTLAISMSFILLPVTIVALIGLKLRRDAKLDAAKK